MEDLYTKVTEIFAQRHHIAHDIKHVTRVAKLAKYIAQQEGYDEKEAEIAGILHDVGRSVQDEEKGHGPAGAPLAQELLDKFTDYNKETKERILSAVESHSNLGTEGKLTHIVQDADMLDGLGAIGIMRAYTSKANLTDYDPENITPAIGKRDTNIHDQIAFQMEWVDFMHTPTAKKIATKRHDFMVNFLKEFSDEAQVLDF
ncbi:MAG: HD domain-containing protein [Candidatus Saccharibacteria bacterium]